MYVLAVTGGIGSGKSTAAELFGERGAVVLDLDHMAKGLIGPGGPLADSVISAFGDVVRAADGGVDAGKLASVAFCDPRTARRLDELVHPGVLSATEGALDMLAAQGRPPGVVVLDIPLLVEAPEFFNLVDGVLVISATEDARLARLLARGMSEEEARARMACQASDADRRTIADWVIENDGTLEEFRQAAQRFWESEVLSRAT